MILIDRCQVQKIQNGTDSELYYRHGDMAKTIITMIFFISVDIDNYHDKCQIFISFEFKARILLHLLIFLKINI